MSLRYLLYNYIKPISKRLHVHVKISPTCFKCVFFKCEALLLTICIFKLGLEIDNYK